VTTVLRRLLDPVRLLTVLPLRLTRRGAVAVARGSRRWELVLEKALDEPRRLLAWDAAEPHDEPVGQPPRPSSTVPAAGDREEQDDGGGGVVDLTEDDFADWAQMPFAAATARARELEPERLRALLDYECEHGHRQRFVQLLQHRLDVAASG
jgi:hypothetical protein